MKLISNETIIYYYLFKLIIMEITIICFSFQELYKLNHTLHHFINHQYPRLYVSNSISPIIWVHYPCAIDLLHGEVYFFELGSLNKSCATVGRKLTNIKFTVSEVSNSAISLHIIAGMNVVSWMFPLWELMVRIFVQKLYLI